MCYVRFMNVCWYDPKRNAAEFDFNSSALSRSTNPQLSRFLNLRFSRFLKVTEFALYTLLVNALALYCYITLFLLFFLLPSGLSVSYLANYKSYLQLSRWPFLLLLLFVFIKSFFMLRWATVRSDSLLVLVFIFLFLSALALLGVTSWAKLLNSLLLFSDDEDELRLFDFPG